ncbi:MAG: DMT family transporter [Bacillota bacterium]|nr:DMT family transporter [Bacillota bacterium]
MINEMTDNRTGKYRIFIILECLIWGVGNPITRYAYVSMTPFCYMAVRFAAAFLIFTGVFYKHIKADLSGEKLKGCLIVGVFMGGAYIFGNIALAESMVTIVGFLMGTSVVFTSLFSVVFLKSRLEKRFIAILAAVVIGMYLLCCGGSGEFAFGAGEIFALLSSACLGSTLILSAKYIKDVSPFTLSAVQCGVTAAACTVFGLVLEDFSCMLHAEPVSWAAMLYLVIGCTVAAFMLQNVSIKHLSPIFVSLAFSTEPIFTAVASFFILGETINAAGIVGSVLIMAGVAAASVMNERK